MVGTHHSLTIKFVFEHFKSVTAEIAQPRFEALRSHLVWMRFPGPDPYRNPSLKWGNVMDSGIGVQIAADKHPQKAGTLNSACWTAPAPASEPRPRVHVLHLVIIAMVALFYLSTMRPGHQWGDDFGLYVLHARNIVNGDSYDETAYLHNPLYGLIGPRAYPPILPLALAPVYKWFGFNATVMKIAVCTFFFAVLWVLYSTYRMQLPWPYATGLIVLLGLNPYFYDFKDEIISDFPFMFFVWGALYAMQRRYHIADRNTFSGSVSYGLLVGTCMYLAYGTRVIGAVLLVSLVVYELVRYKKLSWFAITALFVAGTLIAIQGTLLSNIGSGYLDLFKQNTTRDIAHLFLANIMSYLVSLSTFLDNGHSKVIKIAFFIMVSLLAVLGLRRRIDDGISVLEVFLFLYVVALVISPVQAFRYLFPIIPIYFLYACIGAIEIRSLTSRAGLQYVPVILAALVAVSYASKYVTLDYGPMQEGIARQESTELFQYIHSHTKPDDVIIFRKPRALALLTGRRVSIYPMPVQHADSSDGEAWKYFHAIGARYLVVGATAWARNPIDLRDIEWERTFAANCKQRCEAVFSNGDFQVYELKDPLKGQAVLLPDK